MVPTIDYAYYMGTYGGQLSEEEFLEGLPPACDHVRWFCHDAEPEGSGEEELYRRALCACCESYAEHGEGAGFTVGDFSWRPTAHSLRGATASDLASRACVGILGMISMAFAGVR